MMPLKRQESRYSWWTFSESELTADAVGRTSNAAMPNE
jgi:hypothetical protein